MPPRVRPASENANGRSPCDHAQLPIGHRSLQIRHEIRFVGLPVAVPTAEVVSAGPARAAKVQCAARPWHLSRVWVRLTGGRNTSRALKWTHSGIVLVFHQARMLLRQECPGLVECDRSTRATEPRAT